MKELTTEQKAKAYDEALERAKKELSNNLDSAYKNYREHLENIFPELKESKESEDERIRKALISILKSDFEKDTTIFDISVEQIIAWLKKQGKKLDPDEVIAWLHSFGCDVDHLVEQFKKDLKL